MSFVSYAQNFENVMLWRALQDVEQGFYIDVGANDPVVDSVTKAFYDMGWRGINIEPVTEWYEKLQQQRSRDINLQVAVGAGKGEVTLYEIPQTGLSTTDKNIAHRHKRDRGYEITTRQAPLRTLTDICQQYHVAPIHFLKIDVEGDEKAVLEGIDFKTIRPWIILIESTLPLTQDEDYQHWEQKLLSAGYQFAYFDGLNRFYCADEQSERIKFYQSPPNVFDGFQLAETVSFCGGVVTNKKQTIEQLQSELEVAEQHLLEKEQLLNTKQSELEQHHAHSQWLQDKWDDAKAKIDELNQSSHHWWTIADGLNQEMQAVYRSKSWRITWPVRMMKRLLIALTSQIVKLIKAIIRSLVSLSMRVVLKNPSLRYKLKNVFNRYPRLYRHLHLFALNRGMAGRAKPIHYAPLNDDKKPIQSTEDIETKLSAMTPRVRKIYMQLKHAIEHKGNV